MTAFRFRAARPDGELLSGTVQAGSPAAALQLVEARGLLPIAVHETATGRTRTLDAAVLAPLLTGLAGLLEAGMPVDRALAASAEAAPDALRPWLEDVQSRVRDGAPLSSALAAAGTLPPIVLGHVRAGERGGALASAMRGAAAELDRAADIRARVRAALTYPVFLAVAGAVSVAAIVTLVIPRFAALLGDQGQALPASTRLLVGASDVMRSSAVPLAVLITILVPAVLRWAATVAGRRHTHRWLLAAPVLGTLRHRFATARFASGLAGLLRAGVPLLEALRYAAEAPGDAEIAARTSAARLDVERGERLASALSRHGVLTPLGTRLTTFGERAGQLPAFLDHAARLEDAGAQRSLQRLVTLLEPVIILAFGLLVAFVATALLQAVYSIRPGGSAP